MWSVETERDREFVWMGLIENARRSLLPNMKGGVSGEKRKYRRGKGGRAKCLWEEPRTEGAMTVSSGGDESGSSV